MKYTLPPQPIVDAIDTPPTPAALVSPDRTRMLLVDYDLYPPIEVLVRPFLRLGGVRVDPVLGARQRTTRINAIAILDIESGSSRPVAIPDGSSVGFPVWSPDATRFALTRDLDDGVELWIADGRTGTAVAVEGVRTVDVIAAAGSGAQVGAPPAPFAWSRDSTTLFVQAVPPARGPAPVRSPRPEGPRVEETAGKVSQMATFQDLLRDEVDDAQFEYFATSQVTRVDVATRATVPIGDAGLIVAARPSPDDTHLLVSRLRRPFSHRVPYGYFSRTVEVWDVTAGRLVATVAEHPVSDEVPRQGVPLGPRNMSWQEKRPATLVWVEALDGGDPLAKVPHREQVMRLESPGAGPEEVVRLQERFNGWQWLDELDNAFVSEFDRDRRWRTTALVDLAEPEESRRVLFDLSVNDVYNHPGSPLHVTRPNGERVIPLDDGWIHMVGQGGTERGFRPFLDRYNPTTGERGRRWQCDDNGYESPIGLTADRTGIITRRETPLEPPNFFIVDLATGQRRRLTEFPDPHPALTGAAKQLIRYERDDGVKLSGTLYLPPGRSLGDGGPRMPTLVWAYPMDYSDPDTAGQVRGSDLTFTRLAGVSPLWLLTEGYAVLMDATMPVVGEPETMNDTFVEQVVAAAVAAVDELDQRGVADRSRMVVSGHSYGGFMTATLLAHSELFVAGIARSGAYNRSLTPFGFQTERRSYWEVPHIYQRVSPFTYAHQIKAPMLLIHGEDDNNSGTFPLQSERLFQAIQGNGGSARLVVLPAEGHGYRARESVLHVISEMLEWVRRHVP